MKTKKQYNKITTEHGFISADPLPTQEELVEHYSAQYYDAPKTSTYQTSYSADEIKQKILRADLNIHAIEDVIGSVANKSLFEIGYGEGFILKSAKNKGMNISGVDFTNSGLKTMHPELVSEVEAQDAYDYIDRLIANDDQFDVCIIQNVLEHVIDPEEMLKRMKAILKPNGIIVINVPNDYSALQMKAIDEGLIDREFWFGPVEHLHYFNTDNLPKFVDSHGFKVKDSFGDFPIDFFLMNSNSNYVMDKTKGKDAHNARIMLDLLMAEKGMHAYHKFCQAMSGVGIGRNICVIAQKEDK